MKIFLLWTVILFPFLITSCTDDLYIESIDNEVIDKKKSRRSASKVAELNPENPANQYDVAGKVHNDILEIYLMGNYQYSTIAQISEQVESIASLNSYLMTLNLDNDIPINTLEISNIVNHPSLTLNQIMVNCSMTDPAKISLSNFIESLMQQKDGEYENIYQSIISYESLVMGNTQFNNEDRRIILTVSSIARYSLFYDKKRKDEDWDTSVGNLVGGVSGAINNSSTAVKMALITGISQNNHVTD
jgi:hypothetical protein